MSKHLFKSFVPAAMLLVFLCAAEYGAAQTPTVEQKQDLEKPDQNQILKNRQQNPAPLATASPPGPVHCVAEWEESEGIMTLWKNADLMNKLQEEHLLYIPVDNAGEEATWRQFFQSNRIPQTHLNFLYIQTGTIWTRDYGPWFIWDADNEMGIVNYTCNYSYWDDLFPSYFATLYRINYYESGLYHVGGNYYPNAFGRAFSSTHVYESNPALTKAQVDGLMEDYFGITRYQTVAPKGIWHHDTWGKPANPETLLIADFPEYDQIHHAQAEGMVDYYGSLESPWGRPYKIHRLPMMPDTPGGYFYRPYCNTLVSNRQVFVPIHDCPDDAVALQAFQDAFVGYDVVGVIAKECGWPDALHCRTRNFVKRDVIRIYPLPPGDTENDTSGYPVTADVIPPNGTSLLAGYPVILWTDTGAAPFHPVVMAPTGQPNEYGAEIPAAALGTTVSFYIEARNDTGLEAIYPLVAPDGMMSFEVRTDTVSPVLSRHIPTRSAAVNSLPVKVRTLCKDDMAAPAVTLEYSVNGNIQPVDPMVRESLCYWYYGWMGGPISPGDVISYRLVASDNAETANSAILPPVGSYYCPVAGPGSVAVVDMCSRPYTGPFLQDALGDMDIPHHYYTEWPADWSEHDVWFICLGVFADNHVLSTAEVNDITAALQAGDRIYLEGGNTWCNDPEKDTLKAWFQVKEVHPWKSMSSLTGLPGTMMDGLVLNYMSEDLQMDEIDAARLGEKIFHSNNDRCRVVSHDGGTYRTLASACALGGLMDKTWPRTRKEILVRYLDFFGVDHGGLSTITEIPMGGRPPIRIEGSPGDQYVLLGSLAEHYLPTDYGVLRLDPDYMGIVSQGIIPAGGVEQINLAIPDNNDFLGLEVHFQAVVGAAIVPGQAQFTNRDIFTVVEE